MLIATGLPTPLIHVMCSMGRRFLFAKGFIVSDDADCIAFSKHINYCRLSAYFLPFRKNDGTYFTGINFSRIQQIYAFDSQIRALPLPDQ